MVHLGRMTSIAHHLKCAIFYFFLKLLGSSGSPTNHQALTGMVAIITDKAINSFATFIDRDFFFNMESPPFLFFP